MNLESPEPPQSPDMAIDVSVPGTEAFVEVLRGVIGRATRVAGFTFDGIEDFALAVDEAAVLLMETSPVRLHLRVLDVGPGRSSLTALITAEELDGSWPPTDLESSTRWQILATLCERVWLLDTGDVGIGLTQSVR